MNRVLLFVLIALMGCSSLDDDEPSEVMPIQTDRSSYEAVTVVREIPFVEFATEIVYRNATDVDRYLFGCNTLPRPTLEKLVDGIWVTAWEPIEDLCLSPPWIIPREGVFRDTIAVSGAHPGHRSFPTFSTEIDGTYRFVARIYHDPEYRPDESSLLPLSERVSNTFELTEAASP